MLATAGVLLPAIVVADGQLPPATKGSIRSVAGTWTAAASDGSIVFTHDAKKWTAKEGFPLALFNTPREFGDGIARIEFKLVDGTDDYSAGLVFGHRGSTYHYVRYNTKDGDVALWRMDGAKRTVIKHGEEHAQLAKDMWHELELRVDGRKVRASVNQGRLVVEHELDKPVWGRLGLWTKPDATTAFRNLFVAQKGEGNFGRDY